MTATAEVSAAVEIDVEQHQPVRRPCTLLTECVIEPGTSDDWRLLAPFHYRDTKKQIPATRAIYRARHEPTGATVGVIVYAAPSLSLRARNEVFGEYFNPGVRQIAVDRANRDIEVISRVVVQPCFRGTGLGVRLIRETMTQRPRRVIEMSAAMGNVNPFAEKAGMRKHIATQNKAGRRVSSALRSVGMSEADMANPTEIRAKLDRLPKQIRPFVEKELLAFESQWIGSRNADKRAVTIDNAIRRVASMCMLNPIYYYWVNHEQPRRQHDIDERDHDDASRRLGQS